MKRLFDIAISLFALLFLWPIFVGCALAILVESSRPIFYRQERVGLNAMTFRIWKFRTMVANADKIGSYQTAEHDKRVTRVGRFLRRTSLDELPQIFNVLKGEMSLVGPRPDVPAQRSNYTDTQWRKRTSVRPGVTGLAQATLRSAATAEQRLQLDLEYVDKSSLVFDLYVLMLTARQVLGKGGF